MMMKLPSDVLKEIAERVRSRRKDLHLSQETLAARSGVSFGSVKRFEGTGKISLESLLKLAVTLEALKDFDMLFTAKPGEGLSLDDILNEPRQQRKKKMP
jgi:transcriptional regulator with XRE-family HTH domain